MTEAAINSSLSKSKGQVALEYISLALCLCVIAVRATVTESPSAQSAGQALNLGDEIYSLSMSAVLILSFLIWFAWGSCSRRFLYRFTAMEIGLCLFVAASIIGGFVAANKRAAITDFVTLFAGILMAVLLVQILDSQSKIMLVLVVIAALGVLSAYECEEQLFFWNEQNIKFYEQNQQAVLAEQGIVPNSLAHWQFEHRLYSKGVHGFFTTSNSAGSFAMLASFAAIALFIDRFRNRGLSAFGYFWLVNSGIAAVIVVFGLVITRSKGAIAASVVAAVMFSAYLLFGKWLKVHKKAILIICLLVVLAGGALVVVYKVTHDRLPGGNSMLVRWQYWTGAAKMYIDHPVTGVGGGNFSSFYPHYKTPAALETVKDPHNFLLTIITQYGPIGLAGFLVMILLPLFRAAFSNLATPSHKADKHHPAFRTLAVIFLIVISIAMLLIRPMILKTPTTGSNEERRAAELIRYVMPVIMFIVGFLLLAAGPISTKTTGTNVTLAALFCAVVGSLIHNLIDFAIFEPGVLVTFWAIMACLIASDFNQRSRPQSILKPAPFEKMIIAAGALALIWSYFSYALIPVTRANTKIKQAHQAARYGKFDRAHGLYAAAAEDDRLSPAALNLNGRLYLQHYNKMEQKRPALLEKAQQCFRRAIDRNEADFGNFERLSTVCNLLGRTQKAYDWCLKATKRYPGSARLQLKLAQIAEELGKTNLASHAYNKAVEIEDSYRSQFRQMYPGRELCSRLGEEEYKNAKERIKLLSEQRGH